GSMRGRDGNVHRGNIEFGLLPMISHLGAMISTVGGMLLARRLQGKLCGDALPVGLCSLGDGAMGTGAAHEGLNVLAVERLPVVIMLANNQLAYSTLNDRSFACRDFCDRALGYGIQAHTCNGEDPQSCRAAAEAAFAAARAGQGPQMVIATMLRLTGHGEHDDATYTPPELMAKAKDCLEVAVHEAEAAGVDVAAMRAEIDALIDEAVSTCLAEPEPNPDVEDWCAYSERWLDQGLVP
ncbi:MAG: thiamine pyrophosphate-dependent dehydrogenase E1 component subunit alpha, partial [Planctomycetota bacterium]